MPSPLRNGVDAHRISPQQQHHHHHFLSTASARKLCRINALILVLRLAAFCSSLTSAVFMSTNASRSPSSPSWLHFAPFRLLFAAASIAAAYSLLEIGASAWEILRSATPFPEPFQIWFDFSHDQVLAYLMAAAVAAATETAVGLRGGGSCDGSEGENAFCVQAYIAVALGIAGFVFLALSALASGFRASCHVITGSRNYI